MTPMAFLNRANSLKVVSHAVCRRTLAITFWSIFKLFHTIRSCWHTFNGSILTWSTRGALSFAKHRTNSIQAHGWLALIMRNSPIYGLWPTLYVTIITAAHTCSKIPCAYCGVLYLLIQSRYPSKSIYRRRPLCMIFMYVCLNWLGTSLTSSVSTWKGSL